MAQVTFPTTAGGDGSTVSDDADPVTGLDAGGHRTRFVPALKQLVNVAAYIVGLVNGIVAQAATAINSPGTSANSTTSLTIGTGSKTLTVQVNKAFSVGQTVSIASAANPVNQMVGPITAFNSATGSMTVSVANTGGTGTFADWVVAVAAIAGVPISRQINGAGLVTGGGDFSADRTLTVAVEDAAGIRAGTNNNKAVTAASIVAASAYGTLAYAATVAWDTAVIGFKAGVLLTGNATIGAPTNLKDGWTYSLKIVQDATGSRLASWAAIWDFGQSGTPVLSTGANKIDYVYAEYDAATGKLVASFRKAA